MFWHRCSTYPQLPRRLRPAGVDELVQHKEQPARLSRHSVYAPAGSTVVSALGAG